MRKLSNLIISTVCATLSLGRVVILPFFVTLLFFTVFKGVDIITNNNFRVGMVNAHYTTKH